MASANTNPISYDSFITNVASLAVVNTTVDGNGVTQFADPPLFNITSMILNYAELRIQRDLDMLPTLTTSMYTLPIGTNILTTDTDDFVTIQTIQATIDGAPTPLLPTSKEYIQNVYGNSSVSGPPQYFAMIGGDRATGGTDYSYILFGPYTDANYALNIFGTIRAPSLYLYSGNSVDASTKFTAISTYYPDLLVLAAMIWVTAYQRQFAGGSSDPQMGPNFENQYAALLKGAVVEEQRKRFAASGWSSMAPATIATPGR